MNGHYIAKDTDISLLNKLMFNNGVIKPCSFAQLKQFSQSQISYFCLQHAIYQLPTIELIDFIHNQIGGESAIEIGSGNGHIGSALGIKMTDNHMQLIPSIKAHYELLGQPVIKYGKDVEQIDAISAVEKYKPEVVVACWVTHKFKDGMEVGNMLGVEEELFFDMGVKKYVHVGNENVHRQKPLLNKIEPKRYKFPWLLSRSMQPHDNVIYVFEKP